MILRASPAVVVVAAIATQAAPAEVPLGTEVRNATTVEDCDDLVRRRSNDGLAYGCYQDLARRQGANSEIAQHLRSLLQLEPDNPWLHLTLGRFAADANGDVALEHYETALEGFLEQRILDGAFYTRILRAFFYQYRNRLDDAAAELEEAERLAVESEDPNLIARARARRGWLAYKREDYGHAWILFKKAEQAAVPDGSRDAPFFVLEGLGAVSEALGRYGEALDYHRRGADILGDGGVLIVEAGVRLNIARLAGKVRVPRRYTLEERRAFAREAMDVALRGGNPQAEADASLLLGRLLEGPAAAEQTENGLRIARELRELRKTATALRQLAVVRFENTPDDPSVFDLVAESIDLARSLGTKELLAQGLAARSELHWRTGRRDRAIEDGLAALEAIEQFRDLQPDEQVRAYTFGRFADVYYGLSGHLLGSSPDLKGGDLELAFRVTEQMRARVLLDALDAAKATPAGGAAHPLQEERNQVLAAIAGVQQRLLDPDLAGGEREVVLSELEVLEVEEAALRDAIAREDPAFEALRRPTPPSLAEVQRSLGEDQALIAFQIEPTPTEQPEWMRGRSWAIVVTRAGARAHRIPDAAVFESNLDLFLGLLGRRDGSEQSGAAWLYGQLLEDALTGLPQGVRRLVVVPDGPLHRLPFGALRPYAGAAPLAAEYAITIAPSATVWLRCKTAVVEKAAFPVLALADPALPAAEADAPYRSADVLAELPGLGPLPQSRREGRELVRRLGGGSRLLEGPEANERMLKSTALNDYRVLHFAAHAVVDHERPNRSAVVLAPGAAEEDGLLQVREVVELDLSGNIVILSACSSAAGTVLQGEGVMGLARAFFQAGAHAVVGSLWPLRDDEAAELVGDFSGHLARGASLTEALAATRLEWIRADRPVASWSGLVLLGNGDFVPFPDGTEHGGWRWPVLAGLMALLLGLVILGLFSRRR